MSHVVVSDTTPRIVYAVGGTPQSVFTVPAAWALFDLTDVKVVVDGVAATYTTSPGTSTEYSVTGVAVDGGFQGGFVTLGAGVSNVKVIVYRDIPTSRESDFPYPSSKLDIRSLNTQLDRIVALLQQLETSLGRSFRLDDLDETVSIVLPLKAVRANKHLAFDIDGVPTVANAPVVDSSVLVVVSATNPGHVNGRIWIDTATPANLIAKQSDGTDWIQLWAVNTTTNTVAIGSLASTTEVLTGTDAAKSVTSDALAALWEKGSDIASAATINVGEGGFFHVTGTTNISDIDFATDKAGREAWLLFEGVLQLTNGANLIVQGNANYTTAAGDMARVVSEGSDVVRVTIFKADGTPIVTPATGTITGEIRMYGGGSAPGGWRLCDGSAISRTTFAALFAVIGTTFGTGDGSTTFNVPDLRGRVPVGAGTGVGLTARSLGATGGEEAHALTIGELAAHNHDIKFDTVSNTTGGGSADRVTGISGAGGTTSNNAVQNKGSGTAHNTMQPFQVLNFIIKT